MLLGQGLEVQRERKNNRMDKDRVKYNIFRFFLGVIKLYQMVKEKNIIIFDIIFNIFRGNI